MELDTGLNPLLCVWGRISYGEGCRPGIANDCTGAWFDE